jgi:hypothetical protein
VGDVNKQEKIYKIILVWLDKQSERRTITLLEQLIKKLIKARYEETSLTKETILRQRAKRHWIKQGDKNISYFHKVVSVQKRQNYIQTLQHQGRQHSDHKGKSTHIVSLFQRPNQYRWANKHEI